MVTTRVEDDYFLRDQKLFSWKLEENISVSTVYGNSEKNNQGLVIKERDLGMKYGGEMSGMGRDELE